MFIYLNVFHLFNWEICNYYTKLYDISQLIINKHCQNEVLNTKLTTGIFTMIWRSFLFWQRENWRAFWRRPAVLVPAILAFLSLIFLWYLSIKLLSLETVILRYSIYVGANWLVSGFWFIIMPSIATIMVLIDLVLAYFVSRTSLALVYLWLWTAVFIVVSAIWLCWLLIRINI